MSKSPSDLPCPSTYIRLLLQSNPAQASALLAGTDLSASEIANQGAIASTDELRIFDNARRLANLPHWALDFGRRLNINSHGPLGFAAVSAATLGEGLATLAEFACIRAPYMRFNQVESDRQLILTFESSDYELGEMEIPMIEIIQQVATSFARAVLGEDNTDTTQLFSYSARGRATLYRQWFGERCKFGCEANGLAVPLALKDLPCPLRDEKTYRSSLARCREALVQLLSASDVVTRARLWLADQFERIQSSNRASSLPTLEQLADSWHVSPRTVIRKLAEHKTSFSKLRDDKQLEMACRMLDDAGYQIGEIGYNLGYGDPANFRRSFRRLTGFSPKDYRRRTR